VCAPAAPVERSGVGRGRRSSMRGGGAGAGRGRNDRQSGVSGNQREIVFLKN